jgi:hypothetical protein
MAYPRKTAPLALVLLALAAPPARPQEQVYVSPGVSFSPGAGFSGPIGASLMAELMYGLGADVKDDGEHVRGRVGGLLQLHGGSGGGKLGLGVGARARVKSNELSGVFSVGLLVSVAHTWADPVGTARGLTYLGPEIDLSVMHVGLSMGTLWRIDGNGGKSFLFSWGVGARF